PDSYLCCQHTSDQQPEPQWQHLMPSATHLSSGLHTTAASGIAGPSMLSYTGVELNWFWKTCSECARQEDLE
ncbi:uncharacterized, partial [Tachysurus ichikawai]